MSLKKPKKIYDLEYIEKIFKVIPLTFILILSIVSMFITFVILESKQKRDIDLLKQKELLRNEFEKKERLLDFSLRVESRVAKELSDINKTLQEQTYRIIGALENSEKLSKLDETINLLEKFEKKDAIDVVLFEQNTNDIIYGHDKISFLSRLIFGKNELKYRNLVLQYIASQGKHNLQEWKNDLTGALRLSFFDTFQIGDKIYFAGTFSKVKNIRYITRSMTLEEIDSLKNTDYSIWFFDLILKSTYNFKGKKLFDNSTVLLSQERNRLKYKILKYFDESEDFNDEFYSYTLYDNKYKFLISIDYEKNISIDEESIKERYYTLFKTIIAYIIFITLLLIVFTLVFSNFTKRILDRYNKKLQDRTKLLTHWKNRFELAIIASNDGLWDIDFETNKIYFSNKWLEISGYDKGEIEKFSDWFNLIHKNDRNSVEFIFEEIFANKRENFISEYRLKTKNDGFKWILARGRLFIDKETGHKRMLMMSMDIDKNKRMKKELLDVELLVEDGKIVLFKLFNDETLSVKYISNAIKNYGYNKHSFENQEMSFYDLIYKEDINIIKVALKAALSQDLPSFTFECRILNAANEIKWVSCRTLLLKDHSGNVTHFYGYINDITKIKLSQEELKEKIEDEVAKNREKDRILIQQSKLAAMGEMLGNIAHQWRQPLNNISLFLQFIKDNCKNEDVNLELIDKYFDKSFTQIKYMSQTIDDFRNFYKPSKQKSIFSIKYAINSTLEIIKAQLIDENIQLILDIEDVQLNTFENEFKQSLLNILNNAQDAILQKRENIKFNPFIKIETKVVEDKLEIDISNNGGQIEEEILSKVFEPYFTTKFESQGTGIGLYMSKSIIETNIKGKLEVSNIENGVNFKITLPIKGV